MDGPTPAKRGEVVPAGLDYVASLESTEVVSVDESYDLWIDGEPSAPATNRYFPTVNPATEETLSRVAEGGGEDVDRAVTAARQAYTGAWGRMAGKERFEVPVPSGPDAAGAVPRVRGAGNARRRQAHQGVAATSICRWPRPISSTTPGGLTSWSTRFPASTPGRWGWWDR